MFCMQRTSTSLLHWAGAVVGAHSVMMGFFFRGVVATVLGWGFFLGFLFCAGLDWGHRAMSSHCIENEGNGGFCGWWLRQTYKLVRKPLTAAAAAG
ncbi:hypothetical protein HDK64DRAFT_41759 [Phyllosticta capitalensis]